MYHSNSQPARYLHSPTVSFSCVQIDFKICLGQQANGFDVAESMKSMRNKGRPFSQGIRLNEEGSMQATKSAYPSSAAGIFPSQRHCAHTYGHAYPNQTRPSRSLQEYHEEPRITNKLTETTRP